MMPPLYRKASVVVPWLILILQLGSEWSSVCRRRKLDGCKEDPPREFKVEDSEVSSLERTRETRTEQEGGSGG